MHTPTFHIDEYAFLITDDPSVGFSVITSLFILLALNSAAIYLSATSSQKLFSKATSIAFVIALPVLGACIIFIKNKNRLSANEIPIRPGAGVTEESNPYLANILNNSILVITTIALVLPAMALATATGVLLITGHLIAGTFALLCTGGYYLFLLRYIQKAKQNISA